MKQQFYLWKKNHRTHTHRDRLNLGSKWQKSCFWLLFKLYILELPQNLFRIIAYEWAIVWNNKSQYNDCNVGCSLLSHTNELICAYSSLGATCVFWNIFWCALFICCHLCIYALFVDIWAIFCIPSVRDANQAFTLYEREVALARIRRQCTDKRRAKKRHREKNTHTHTNYC